MARGATTQRAVGFAKEINSIREPRDDELYVMERFAHHAARCAVCADPYAAYRRDVALCDRGTSLGRDVARYVYAKGGKPFSTIDRMDGDRIQINIPAGCDAVAQLVKAFDRGLVLKVAKPVVVKHDAADRPAHPSSRTERPHDQPVDRAPRERRYRQGDVNVVEVVPGPSRRERERRDTVYHGDRPHRDRKGSLYTRDEEEKRRRRGYDQQPIVIVGEPRRRYVRL